MEKAKRRFRFNFIDALLLLILFAAMALLGYIFLWKGEAPAQEAAKTEIVYVIETKEIREELRGLVNVGDKIVDTVGHYALGEVINVQYSDMIYSGLNEATGQVVNSPFPNHVKVAITVRASADVSDSAYSIGGYRMSVGTKVYFRVPHFTFSGYCVSLTADSANQ